MGINSSIYLFSKFTKKSVQMASGVWADITVVTYGLKPSGKFCNGVDVSIPQLFDYLSNTPSNTLLVPDGVPTNVKKWAPDRIAPKVFEVSDIQF